MDVPFSDLLTDALHRADAPQDGSEESSGEQFELAARGSRDRPIVVEHPDHVAEAGERVQEPTEAQALAGNYRQGHIRLGGLNISIETPKGGIRRGKDPSGKPWETVMPAAYGAVKGHPGADGDNLDVFIGDDLDAKYAYVINQRNTHNGEFDELKMVIGARSPSAARRIYSASFSDKSGSARLGGMAEIPIERIRDYLSEADLKGPVRIGRYF